jgi:hypothetical protein
MALVPAAQSGSQRRQQTFRRLLRCLFFLEKKTHQTAALW